MSKNYGKTILDIRNAKNVSVKNLISGIIGRTAYSNFVNDKNCTSVDTFMKLLNRLHVSYSEFQFIANGLELDQGQKLIIELQKTVARGDVSSIKKILEKAINYCYVYEGDERYHHLACITQLMLDRLQQVTLNFQAKKIITDYLTKCETWTHYELVIFNNVMFIFSIDQIRIFRQRVLHNLEKYQNLRVYGSESFRVLINMLMIFIDHQVEQDIKVMMGLINNYQLNDDMLFEKNLRLYFVGILKLIQGNQLKEGISQIKRSLSIFADLGACNYKHSLARYLQQVIKIYQIEI